MRYFLTDEERSKILHLRNVDKMSIYNIAKQIHRGRKSVSKFINNPEDYIKEMEAYLAISPEGSKPLTLIRRVRPRPKPVVTLRKFLTEAERVKINELRSQGKSLNNIATLIGRGVRTIKDYAENPDGYEEFINKIMLTRGRLKPKLPNLLSDKHRLKVLQLKETGLTPSKIARKMRQSHESIMAFLKNPNDNEYEQFIAAINTTPKKGAYQFENKVNGVNGTNRTPIKRYLTEEERSKILQLREENKSLTTMTRLMHRSSYTINAFLKDPIEYENEAKAYQEFRKSRKSRKTNTSYRRFNESLSEDDLKSFHKLSIEYRSVIKFLVKKGATAKLIFEDLKKVYGKSAPNFTLVSYWTQQFQHGRQTILNEAMKTSGILERTNEILNISVKSENSVSGSSGSGSGGSVKKPPVKVKLFQFKFKPLKRLTEQ